METSGGINSLQLKNTIENAHYKSEETSLEKKIAKVACNSDDKELRKVCGEFEAMMLKMMYKQMKSTVPESGLIPESMGRTVFETMLDEKLIEEATKGVGTGIGDMLYKQLQKMLNNRDESPDGNSLDTKV